MTLTLLRSFRFTALCEGLSYLVLLGVAMPLKYLADMPLATRLVGGLHGALFVLYVVLVAALVFKAGWSVKRGAWAVFLSLIPFGTFMLEKPLKREIQERSQPQVQ